VTYQEPPMTSAELLVDAVGGSARSFTGSSTAERLAFRIDPEANSIAWLVWPLTRNVVQAPMRSAS
jgi:hypothetical protein